MLTKYVLNVMFKKNNNYNASSISHSVDAEGHKQVVIYPENQLPDIVVTSEFGDCQVVTSDVYDLFNQQRIANLGADVVRDFIARNYPQSSSISDAISKMSDDEIMSSIKPRNIQCYSELIEWSKYLNSQIENGLISADQQKIETSEESSEQSSSE